VSTEKEGGAELMYAGGGLALLVGIALLIVGVKKG
jgi:hypothetical protein